MMHRLARFRGTCLRNVRSVSTSILLNNGNRMRTCLLCGRSSNTIMKITGFRDQSTNSIPLLNVVTAKKRRKNKKFTEVLEVTDDSTTQSKAFIKKLKSKELSLFVQEADTGGLDLHEMKTSRFTSNNPADPSITTVEFDDAVEHPEETSSPEQLEIGEVVEKTRDKARKEEDLYRMLGSHIEMCVVIGDPGRGLNSLTYYRNRERNQLGPPVKNINVYNALLRGFAHKSNFMKIRTVLHYAEEDSIRLNVNSYMAILYCLGGANQENNRIKYLQHYSEKMVQNKISWDDLMNRADYVGNERSVVLRVLRELDPTYSPTYKPPRIQYSCKLLKQLNQPSQLSDECVWKSCKSDGKNVLFTGEQLKQRTRQQLDIEKAGYVHVRSIESKTDPGQNVLQYRESVNKLWHQWESDITAAFEKNLKVLLMQPKNCVKNSFLDPYLRCLPVSDYAHVILDEVRRLAEGSETYSPTTGQLHRELGARVYARYRIDRKIQERVSDKILSIHESYCDWYSQRDENYPLNTRQCWQWLEYRVKEEGATVRGVPHIMWNYNILTTVGEFLYKIIMNDLKLEVKKKQLPAFYTLFRSQGHFVKEEVKPHPALAKLLRSSEPETLTFPVHELPMHCPPRPWTSVTNGGYLMAHADVVRLPPQAYQQWHRLVSAPPDEMYPSLDTLNQLGAVAWAVNKKILDIILKVFRGGGSSKLNVPEPPSACPKPIQTKDKYTAFRQRLQYRRKKAEMYSLWCDALYRLSLANHFRNDVFWLPHNMDFRGRVYPIPPHLNHLGSDLARSMLVFAEGRPLGPHGLNWLKIHCINLTGTKKHCTIDERSKYADEMMEDILDSADHPLEGKMWWAESDEPWQTLACCMEIANAIRSGLGADYVTRFPVHQDGSCNGLQHYAALGRDSAGAFSVNLSPAEKPQDVYSSVAALVEERRVRDAAEGNKVAQTLAGFIRRKVIKQTVMTTVYGVTRFGARLQIARQLKDLDDFPKEAVWIASTYLTARTFESLRSMFTSTKEIQDWFTECARLIAAVNGRNVEWVTPLGLPVVQPYTHLRRQPYISMDLFDRPNVMKQKNAFPPNFIHSLDSSHMMLTSLFCERVPITFVSVHDCFWTHPCSVAVMNQVCREQFVALHSQPILEDLSAFMMHNYSYKYLPDDGSALDLTKRKLNRLMQKLPARGEFDLSSVLKSVYFFS